ncbi:MAG: hypothetical protein HC893_16465, partial [Chloroflexaceae bacterium]|nr:hypothetical protein [Chloroflexaceae bacterium]
QPAARRVPSRRLLLGGGAVVALVLAFSSFTLAARFMGNIAMFGLRDALLAASAAPAIDPRPREYTIYQRLPADALAAQRARFAQALTMAPTSTGAQLGALVDCCWQRVMQRQRQHPCRPRAGRVAPMPCCIRIQ